MNNKMRAILALFLVFVLSIGFTFTWSPQNQWNNLPVIGVGEKPITIGHIAYAAVGTLDYTCDGVDDDVQYQAALNALPAGGGKIIALAGTYDFSATVSRAIDNIVIQGTGRGTYFANDGVTALFSAGAQANWVFRDIRTDAGGITVATATNYRFENVYIGTTDYNYTRSATFIVAANNTATEGKAQADYVCDLVDDHVQIQAAIDAAEALPNGGTVQLLDATFSIGAPLTIQASGVKLVGQGVGSTLISLAFNTNTNMIEITGNDVQQCEISSLRMWGEKAQQTSGHGIYISTPTTTGADAMHIFRDLYISDVDDDGVVITSGDQRHMVFYNVFVNSPDGDGWNIRGTDHVFQSCNVLSAGEHGWDIASTNSRLIDSKASGSGQLVASRYGFEVGACDDLIFNSCFAQLNEYDGWHTETANSKRIKLISCTSDRNGVSGTTSSGAKLWNGTGWQFIGGFYGNAAGSNQDYGILLQSGADDCLILGVTFEANSVKSILDESSGTHIIEDNIGAPTFVFADLANGEYRCDDDDVITLTAGENITAGELVFVSSDGKFYLTDADTSANMTADYLAVETIEANSTGLFISEGYWRDTGKSETPGAKAYASTTPGAITTTAPSGSGDQLQKVGKYETVDILHINLDSSVVEID